MDGKLKLLNKIKAEGMTQFDIFHVFVENSVNSELCFSYVFLNDAILGSVPSISSEVLGLLFNFEIFWPVHKYHRRSSKTLYFCKVLCAMAQLFFVMPGYIKIFS